MAFAFTNGTTASYTLNPSEVATIKQIALTDEFLGMSDQQVADILNTPTTIPNPKPVPTVPVGAIPKGNVQAALIEIVLRLNGSDPKLATKWTSIRDQVNLIAIDPFQVSDLKKWFDMALQDGVIQKAQIDAMVGAADPSYAVTLPLSARALFLFSQPVFLEAQDVTDAKAS